VECVRDRRTTSSARRARVPPSRQGRPRQGLPRPRRSRTCDQTRPCARLRERAKHRFGDAPLRSEGYERLAVEVDPLHHLPAVTRAASAHPTGGHRVGGRTPGRWARCTAAAGIAAPTSSVHAIRETPRNRPLRADVRRTVRRTPKAVGRIGGLVVALIETWARGPKDAGIELIAPVVRVIYITADKGARCR